MHLKARLRQASGVAGTFEWDSETGELGGTMARQVAIACAEALAAGATGYGPQCCVDYPVTDPLHTPVEMAVIVATLGWSLPPELEAVQPEPPGDELLYDPDGPTPDIPGVQL